MRGRPPKRSRAGPARPPVDLPDSGNVVRELRSPQVTTSARLLEPRRLRKRHRGITWKDLYRRFLTGRPGNRPAENGIVMFDTMQVEVTRYRWRASNIPTPWTSIVAVLAAT